MTNTVLIALTLLTNVWTNRIDLVAVLPAPACAICGLEHHELEIGIVQLMETVKAIGVVEGKSFELTLGQRTLDQWNVTNEVRKIERSNWGQPGPIPEPRKEARKGGGNMELPGGIPEILAGPVFRLESARAK